MFIKEDYLKNPQKIIFLISIVCIILCSFIHLISLKIYRPFSQNYLDDFQLAIEIILYIYIITLLICISIAGCCWQCKILKKSIKTPLRRFFLFWLIIPVNVVTFLIGLFVLISSVAIDCPKCQTNCTKKFNSTKFYNLTDCHVYLETDSSLRSNLSCYIFNDCKYQCENYSICDSYCTNTSCYYKKFKSNYHFYVGILSFQAISFILLLVAYIIMFTNLSDKEIRELKCKNNYIIDYFRSPQKYFLLVAMIGLILGTIAQFFISMCAILYNLKIEAKMNELNEEINNSSRPITTFGYKCDVIDECSNIHLYENENTCSDVFDCYKFDSDFYLTDKCDYLPEYIYNCTNSSGYHKCRKIAKCEDIDRIRSPNNCSYWDNCPNYDYFYYYGYCNFTEGYVYNCTMNDNYFNFDVFTHGYNCIKYANCSELNQITNNCSYWENCDTFAKNFNYTFYCNYTDFIYKCSNVFLPYYEENMGYTDNIYLYKLIFVIGLIQFAIVIPLFIMSLTCWKGNFFWKMFEMPFTRYLVHFIPSIIYPVAIIAEIFILYFDYEKNDIYISMITFLIVQIISFLAFVIGILCVKLNKSDIEIIENSSELTKPLVKNF